MLPCLVCISLWLKPWKKPWESPQSHSFIDYWRYGKGHAHAGTDSRASTKHSRYRTYLCCYHSGWNWRLFSLFKARQASCLFRYWPSVCSPESLPAHKTRCQKGGQDCFAEYFSQLLLLISAPSGTKQLTTLYWWNITKTNARASPRK